MANCRNSVWSSLNELRLGICDVCDAGSIRVDVGLRFCKITVRSLRWFFFTVPTLTFQLLYCFFVIEHGRARFCTST
jgi:hypothetical protein